MKERPIIFSTEMVQAILEGKKTMTRRIMKDQNKGDSYKNSRTFRDGIFILANGAAINWKCPYGKPNDQLWVKETFTEDRTGAIYYRADYQTGMFSKWKPSIFMPRSTSRIDLLINSIRVEQLKDITNEDAKKEGVRFAKSTLGYCYCDYRYKSFNIMTSAVDSFKSLWEKINGIGSWKDNPWVWVIEFKRIKP